MPTSIFLNAGSSCILDELKNELSVTNPMQKDVEITVHKHLATDIVASLKVCAPSCL